MDQKIPYSVHGYPMPTANGHKKGNADAFGYHTIFKWTTLLLILILAIVTIYILFLKPVKNETEQVFVSAYHDPVWEFPRENLSLGKYLSEGAFGKVHKGVAKGIISKNIETTVAVKMCKDNTDNFEFMSEINLMKKIGKHDNIINLLGCCTQGQGPLYAIIEFASNGNIGHFLKSKNPRCSQMELLSYAEQVARGMEYLASKKYIHRDIASRNILVTEKLVIKIADFGLSRSTKTNGYYKSKNKKAFPERWMAPEALFQNKYTTKTDVWSYGVLLWEIFTHGSVPYYIGIHQLMAGKRLDKPPSCSNKIYSIMLHCWSYIPDIRPSFKEIEMYINQILSSSQE